MKAYKFKIEQELEKDYQVDVTQEKQEKIKKDLKDFEQTYLKLE